MKFSSKISLNTKLFVLTLIFFTILGIVQGNPIDDSESDISPIIIPTPKIPVRLQKSGSQLKPEFLISDTSTTNASPEVKELGVQVGPIVEEYPDYEEYSDNDICEEDTYWHLRLEKCVPLRCPERRDPATGNCISNRVRAFGSYGNPRYYGRGGTSWMNRNRYNQNGFRRGFFGRKG